MYNYMLYEPTDNADMDEELVVKAHVATEQPAISMALKARIVGYCNAQGPETIRLSVYTRDKQYFSEKDTKRFLRKSGIENLYLVDHYGTIWEISVLLGLPTK